ncbi:MAG TPA: MarR family transcriptional regulator [Saprospiraceae bacterium]|nr:MarR family transcriptional regulator [Saprospiraceae bacterium]
MNYLDILIKLRKVIRSINLESKKIEKKYGISIPQLLVLQFLSKQQDFKAKSSDIKSFIHLNASTVSGIIRRLEGKGLVARLPAPLDRRATFITLTAKGAQLLEESPTTLQEKLSNRLFKLEETQKRELYENIDLLVALMEVEDIDASPIVASINFQEEE